ncbi:MAG: SIMPL domain-containing protein [Candidatus Latescibacterota bacterium]|nr:MAG: SIMPL domain-containing protein [Candidatus Latescibacterota bacterium]
MHHKVILVSVVCVCAIFSVPVVAGDGEIVVTGSGTAIAKPDFITVNATISALKKKPSEASRIVEVRYQAVIEGLELIGIKKGDIETVELRVSPEWKRDERGREGKFRGYRATHGIRVRFRETERARVVVDALARAGVGQVRGPRYHTANADSVYRAALAEAVREARANAETIAAADGQVLGELIEVISPNANEMRGWSSYDERLLAHLQSGGIEQLATGERLVRIGVLARWKIGRK